MARGGRPGFPTRPPERLAAAPNSKFLSPKFLSPPAYHFSYERSQAALVEMGYRMITCGSDFSTLMRGFRENLRSASKLG